MATDPNKKTFARLLKLHPNLVMAYLNPDGRKVAIYKNLLPRRKANGERRPDFRWTVYGKNWKVTHASTEGFRNKSHALLNASMPTAIPPIPHLGNGICWEHISKAQAKRGS